MKATIYVPNSWGGIQATLKIEGAKKYITRLAKAAGWVWTQDADEARQEHLRDETGADEDELFGD